MSTGVKTLLALIVLLLIGGWFFMNKPADTVTTDSTNTEEVRKVITEDSHNHDHDVLDASKVAEIGTVATLPIIPILGQRSVGNPNAPVKIQEFFSLTCNHCADFHTSTFQELKTKYIDTGKVYFTFQEFPLNGPALYGSMVARCLPEQRYEGFMDLLLRNQEVWAFSGDFKAALQQNAKLAGMSDEEFETCFNNEELQKAIATNIGAATDAYKISSTPSFVFNDGARIMRGGKSIEAFNAVIEELLKANNNNVQEEVAPALDAATE
jgi:protein-disulfide isomerase